MRRALLLLALIVLGLTSGAAFAAQPYGRIGEKYAALRGPAGALGPAIGNETDAPYGGRYHLFKEGVIYWHPEIGEAYAVWGAIALKHWELGRTEFGYPITDERTTPDGRGRYNHFRAMQAPGRPESSIYWTPQTGAHAVYGLIRDAWARGGWERGELGYPTSDEFQDGKYRRSNFERGYILWAPDTGVKVVKSGAAVDALALPKSFGAVLVTGMDVAVNGRRLGGDSNFLSENAVCAEWLRNRGVANEAAKQLIRAEANPQMRGFSIRSDARMQLSTACSFRAEVVSVCDDTLRLRTVLPGNTFLFHVTTPSAFGAWSDPEFSLDFDLEAVTTIRIPLNGGAPVVLGPSTVRPSNVRLDSQNYTGDIALALHAVQAAVTGRDFTSALAQDHRFTVPGARASLNRLSPLMSQIPQSWRVNACVVDGSTLRLNGVDGAEQGPIVR
ncbi:LGFP repeat-containing protein [Caulobacter sp. 17J80-11]|uniref:LGFP repeat-containing protein n=1 Tax=Caulobacter sp. 17J80-11 TaxID=2763502 RepID=UPI001653C015|nr:hypothetical protein [Caulobacter sp. 17J80-11]MBC6980120.1 hypothetical protein [Caulobacter sp. 17J80-11]